jgi:bacteriocin-like protein
MRAVVPDQTETTMSKTSVKESTNRELTEDELNQIAGGTPSIPIPPPTPHSYAIGRIQARFPTLT